MLRLSRVGCSLAVLLLALGIAGVYTVPILTPTAKTSHRSSVTHARSSRTTTRTSHVDASLPRFAELHSAAQRPSHGRHHSSHRFQATNNQTTTNTTSAPLVTGVPDAFTVSNVCWKLATRQIVVPSTDKRSGHYSFTSNSNFYVWRGCQPSGGACWRTLWSLSLKTLEWTQSGVTSDASEDAMAASFAAYAKYGDIIYDVGGERGSSEGRRPSNIMGALYPSAGRWVYAIVNSTDNIPPMVDASLTVVGTRLYLFGGEGEKERYNTLWSCDISNAPALRCNWEKVNMSGTAPEPRSGHTATAVGPNGMIVFGGQSSSGSLADMWWFNLRDNKWSLMNPKNPSAAPTARAYHTAIHSGSSNKLFIIGGYSSDAAYFGDVKVYDFGSKAWQSLPDSFNAGLTMPALKRLHATRMGDQVLLSGGCGASGNCHNVLNPLLLDMKAVCAGSSGPGVCQNGNYTESNKVASCSCNPGFRGKFCESVETCVRNCSSNGVCRDGNCQCNLGFGGADCSKTVCPNACSGNGACSLSLSKCICNVGKWGLDCSQDNCPNNCYGRGTCKEKPTPTGENICECLPGYSGKDCGQWAAVNQTTPADPSAQPASMDMILTTSGLTRKQVSNAYDPGFSCTNHCSGHGFCIKQFGTGGTVQGRCQCIPGFGGIDCSGECTVHCSGSQGVCSGVDPLTVQCTCKEGFKGVGCFESYCARNCTSPAHGKCDLESNKCGCIYPYSGPACAIDYTCSGRGDFSDGKCRCKPGWGGFNCETAVSCPDNCNGRGDCMGSEPQGDTKTVTGTCVCKEGFTGDRCHIQTCPKDCSGNGKCGTSAKCECFNGWIGNACDMQVKCPNNCTAPHRGQCVPTGQGDEGTCKCSPGWTGAACEMVGCASECYNHGKCVEAQCICDDGYSGKNCEIACPNKCSGRGACISGKCECRPGFGSEDCSQRRVCPGNGTADGECGSLASPSRGVCDWAKGECYCSPGFSSADCSKIDTCGVGCGPNGQCKHGQCFCDPGWKGKHCEEQASCEDNCMNRGLCANGRCYCNTGFNGTKCEIIVEDYTCPKNCTMPNGRPGGLCQYGRCHCLDGHSGEDCNTYSPSKCRANGQTENCDGNGMCVYNKCFCDPGYAGSHCAQRETCKAGCVKGQGVCLLGECKCLPGFTGPDCSQDIVCEGSPTACGGNGVCVQGTCACFPGYRGRGCEVVTVLADKQCPKNCSNMGVCHMGRCFCVDGHSGPDCAIVTQSSCPNACSGRGLCRFGQCFCKPGFSGRGCEAELRCDAECLLNGVCAHGFCFCAPGWKGKNCNVPLNVHETRRQLERDVEYAVAMSRALAPSTLANVNATVTVTVNGTETSKTVNVADGSFCAGGCNLRGFCINNKCACKSGWMGARCEIPRTGAIGSRCGNNCNGNGFCLFGECTCKIGWGGKYCERKQTFTCPNDCNGRGVCHLGRCVCDIGVEGHACERKSQCKPECVESGFGLCYRGKCVCVKGRTGESCEQTVDVPSAPRFREVTAGSSATLVSPSDGCPSSCAPHGICMNQQCYCKNGFTGADCSLAAVSQDYVAKLTAAGSNLLSDSSVTPSVSHALTASTPAAVDGRTWYVVVGAICGFAGGVLAALMGYMWWERYKEQQRAKATQQILKPLLHTLE